MTGMAGIAGERAGQAGRRTAVRVGVEVAVNLLLPFVLFQALRGSMGEGRALLASAAPPLVWSGVELVRARRIDALSALTLLGIALSAAAMLMGGSVRLIQLRDKMATGLVGLVFLGSLAIDRPLIFEISRATLARRGGPALAAFEARSTRPGFRRAMRLITAVWGVGLLAEAAFACWLVFQLPVATFLLVGPMMGYGVSGALALWTVGYVRFAKRRAVRAESTGGSGAVFASPALTAPALAASGPG